MGSEKWLHRKEKRQDKALQSWNFEKAAKIQYRQEKQAAKLKVKGKLTDEAFELIDKQSEINELQKEVIDQKLEHADVSSQLTPLYTKVRDLRKQLSSIDNRTGDQRNLALAQYRSLLTDAQKVINNQFWYDKMLYKGRFLEDIRTQEDLETMVTRIEEILNEATKTWSRALTDVTFQSTNNTNTQNNQNTQNTTPETTTNTTPSTNTPANTVPTSPSSENTQTPNTWVSRAKKQIIESQSITPQGKREALTAINSLNKIGKIGSYVLIARGIFELVFKENKSKDGNGMHQWRKKILSWLTLWWGLRALNSYDFGSQQRQADQVEQTMSGTESYSQTQRLIMSTLGSQKLNDLKLYTTFSTDGTITNINRQQMIDDTQNSIFITDKDKKIASLQSINNNNGTQEYKKLLETLWLTTNNMEANGDKTLAQIFTEKNPTQTPTTQQQTNPETPATTQPTITEQINSRTPAQDTFNYLPQLKTFNLTPEQQNNIASRSTVMRTKYPDSNINFLKDNSNPHILYIKTFDIVTKCNISTLTMEGFETDTTGSIKFTNIQELLSASRQNALLLRLAQKLLEKIASDKRPKNPFEANWTLNGGGIDISVSNRNGFMQVRDQITTKFSPFDTGQTIATGASALIVWLLKKSFLWWGAAWLSVMLWRWLTEAIIDASDPNGVKRSWLSETPTIKNNINQYISYLNKRYNKELWSTWSPQTITPIETPTPTKEEIDRKKVIEDQLKSITNMENINELKKNTQKIVIKHDKIIVTTSENKEIELTLEQIRTEGQKLHPNDTPEQIAQKKASREASKTYFIDIFKQLFTTTCESIIIDDQRIATEK